MNSFHDCIALNQIVRRASRGKKSGFTTGQFHRNSNQPFINDSNAKYVNFFLIAGICSRSFPISVQLNLLFSISHEFRHCVLFLSFSLSAYLHFEFGFARVDSFGVMKNSRTNFYCTVFDICVCKSGSRQLREAVRASFD